MRKYNSFSFPAHYFWDSICNSLWYKFKFVLSLRLPNGKCWFFSAGDLCKLNVLVLWMVFPIILVLLLAAAIPFCANNIDFWSAVVKLDAADSALCTAAGGHALSWLLNYHLWWSRWLNSHPERQECVWEAPVGYKWHSDVTFPRMCYSAWLMRGTCRWSRSLNTSHTCWHQAALCAQL